MATSQGIFLMWLFSVVTSTPTSLKNKHSSTYDNKTLDYRLPQIYTPSNYNLTLKVPTMVAGTSPFSGRVLIKFTVSEATNIVVLHASHEFLNVQNVTLNDVELEKSEFGVENETDFLTVNFTSTGGLTTDREHLLNITFDGILSDTDMYGLYKSYYVGVRGRMHYIATTQFEPVYARRAFPCFDEPHLKATFDVTVNHGYRSNILFNTPAINSSNSPALTTTTVIFERTPVMSIYLLAFVISDFSCTSGETIEGENITSQVCSRTTSTKEERQWALETAPKILRALNSYTNYNYSISMQKIDQAAIPDLAFGAMENWGLVTYRETAILWNPEESSNVTQQGVATIIAHEFAHQWFGNLVTPKWWSETFLSEGFARYFEYIITHEVFESWEMNKQFVTAQVQTALTSDALEGVQALQSNCSSPAEITSKFGTISYSKGASIIRMVSHMMGQDNFKTGVQTYLSEMKNGNVEPDDLWDVLQNSIDITISKLPEGTDLKTVMKNWVTLSGFPILTVTLYGSLITISQERFLLSGEDKSSKWYIPISYSASTRENNFESTYPDAWLSTTDDTLMLTLPPDSEWVILNNQATGYYRVNYDDSLWTKISNALKSTNFSNIHELNRAQIVDDVFNLAKVEKIKYSKAFEILEFLENDSSYYSWVSALNGFEFMLHRLGVTSDLGKSVKSHLLQLMQTVYSTVPLTQVKQDDQIYTLKQSLITSWACLLGEQNCITQSTNMFKDYYFTDNKVQPNLRPVVYCTALRQSTNADEWDFLWNKYNETYVASEKQTILTALGCSKYQNKLKEYLNFTLSDDFGIRQQNALTVFAAVYNGNPENVDIAFEFLVQNYRNISERYKSMNALENIITGIAAKFTTEEQVNKLKNFTETATELSEEVKAAVNIAIKTSQENIAWNKKYADELTTYYFGKSTGSASSLKLSWIYLLCISVVYYVVNCC